MKWLVTVGLILIGVDSIVFLAGCAPPGGGSSGDPGGVPGGDPGGKPDLTVSSIQVPSSPPATSDTWTLGATISNVSTADASSFTILYQVNTANTLSGATTIGTSTVTGLAAGSTYTDTWSTAFSIPQSGTHWVFVTVDSTSAVTESSESNNTSSAAVAVKYDRIVIQTYLPVYGYGTSVMTVVSLFGSSGDTTTETPDLWNGNADPWTTETSALAESTGVIGAYGSIDITTGLAPGTYYVRVRGLASNQVGAYGIRVLDTAPDSPTDSTWSWYFAAANTTDANPDGGSYETDNLPVQGGVPTSPVTMAINQKRNRWLTADGDVDWFVLVLP